MRGPNVPTRTRSLAGTSRPNVAAGSASHCTVALETVSAKRSSGSSVSTSATSTSASGTAARVRSAMAGAKSTATMRASGKRSRRCAVSIPVPQPSSRIEAGGVLDARGEVEREPLLHVRVRVVGRRGAIERRGGSGPCLGRVEPCAEAVWLGQVRGVTRLLPDCQIRVRERRRKRLGRGDRDQPVGAAVEQAHRAAHVVEPVE